MQVCSAKELDEGALSAGVKKRDEGAFSAEAKKRRSATKER